MREYIKNSVRLGRLIEPKNRKLWIYRTSGETEVLQNSEKSNGKDVLGGFELNVQEIFRLTQKD